VDNENSNLKASQLLYKNGSCQEYCVISAACRLSVVHRAGKDNLKQVNKVSKENNVNATQLIRTCTANDCRRQMWHSNLSDSFWVRENIARPI